MFWIILLVIVGVLLFLYFRFFKIPKLKNIVFIDGSLGSGKSYYSVALAVRLYKRQLLRWRIRCKIGKALSFMDRFKSMAEEEKPFLYSNILLRNIDFVKLTKDLLYRQNYRFAYRSVILLDEASLLADQFCYKDREMSERLSNFWKLLRHEMRGGFCVINSQSTSDMHYSLKYVLSDYIYLHHSNTKLPFFSIVHMQEMFYTADKDGASIVNARTEDIEETLKIALVSKKYFKYYDTFCYSIFTDDLAVYCKVLHYDRHDSLKDENLLSFKEYKYLLENLEKERKSKHESK